MKPFRLVLVFLASLWMASAENYPTFEEGDVNSTITINLVVSEDRTLRCTVKDDSESQLSELNVIPPPLPGENWEVIKGPDKKWVEVKISKATVNNQGKQFTCTAINSEGKSSELTYVIDEVKDGPTFEEGAVNSTIIVDLTIGVIAEIRCTIKDGSPAITELDINPPPPIGNIDYRIIRDENKWVGVRFESLSDTTSTYFTCNAVSNATTAFLYYNISVFDGIKFSEGNTNGTVDSTIVTETTDSIRCTIESSDPPVTELSFQPEPAPGNEDYRIKHNGTSSVEVEFLKITDNTPTFFECRARNNMTTATLTYNMLIKDPVPPLFTLGGNDTIWVEVGTGSDYTLFCDVVPGVAVPPVTVLTAIPPTDKNWKVVEKDLIEVEIQFKSANSTHNKRDYVCSVSNGVRTTTLIYQNYVGGPPSALEVSIDPVEKKDTVEISMTVIDRNTAPARYILASIEGVSDENVTLEVPRPDTYDDEITYAFDKFMKPSLSSIKGSPVLKIYANNTLGEVFIKDVPINPRKANSNSNNSGEIAAGILVPFFLVLGAVIIGLVIFYFWRKSKQQSVGFSRINSDSVEDAHKSSYGAL